MADSKLSHPFLKDLFKLSLVNKEVALLLITHLKYHYLPNEEFKAYFTTFKKMFQLELNKESLPTIANLSMRFNSSSSIDTGVTHLLNDLNNLNTPTITETLNEFESFLKDCFAQDFYIDFAESYNKGAKGKKEAIQKTKDFYEKIEQFNLNDSEFEFTPIFTTFHERTIETQIQSSFNPHFSSKVPFFIDDIDRNTHGGLEETDICLFVAQSGAGKTKFLRFCATQAARVGFDVLHIQLEGSKDDCLLGFDATFSSKPYLDLKTGNLTDEEIEQYALAASKYQGEVHVKAVERFNSGYSILDLRKDCYQFYKIHGKFPELITLDYFELMEPGDGKNYSPTMERQRRKAIGRGLKDLAVEIKSRISTATQASTVDPTDLNNPNFVMTRYNVSEFKAIVDPFSIFMSFNQTDDEKKEKMARIHFDKVRKAPTGETIHICQAYDYDRFYDKKRTLKLFHTKGIEQEMKEMIEEGIVTAKP